MDFYQILNFHFANIVIVHFLGKIIVDYVDTEFWMLVRWLGLAFLFITAYVFGIPALRNYRAKKPLFEGFNWYLEIGNVAFISMIMFILFSQDYMANRGWNGWWIFLFPLILVLPAMVMGHFSTTRARKSAVANPRAIVWPTVSASPEEVKVNLKLSLGVILFCVLSIGPITYFAFAETKFSQTVTSLLFFHILGILAFLAYAAIGRWPWDISNSASVVINATPQDIWKVFRFRQSTNWWKKIVSRVDSIEGERESYLIHYFNMEPCGQCGLPHNPDSTGRKNRVEIMLTEEPHKLVWRAYPPGTGGFLETMMDYEEECFSLTERPEGGTLVSSTSKAHRPKVWLAAILKIGDPTGEELRTLKAHIEGVETDTLFAIGGKRLEALRRAEKFCGCNQNMSDLAVRA